MTPKHITDFRTKTTLGLAITTVLLLTPFAIFQLVIESNIIIGVISLAIVSIFAINAWNCNRGKYNYKLTFIILAPIIIIYLAYAFQTVGAISMFWCYPAVLSFYFMLPERQAWIANMLFVIVVIPQAWMILEPQHAIRLTVSLLMVIIFSALFMRVITNQQHKLSRLALNDSLTGLLNRTSLHETLEHAIMQSKRLNIPAMLISLDLDHFKSINDSFGHDVGDSVLREVGEYLHGRIRHSDKVFRLGGEEFLVVLYDTDMEQGLEIAEELRIGISSLATSADKKVTASIGVAELQANDDWNSWMKRSDMNLYSAKQDGRNMVVAELFST